MAWARAAAVPIEISGGFAAAAMAGPNRIAVLDLASGAELATFPLEDRERSADLSLTPDGRLAVATRAGVLVGGPGAAPRLVPGTKGLSNVHLVGETITATEANGRAVAIGVGGGQLTALRHRRASTAPAGDAAGYAWIANGWWRSARLAALVHAAFGEHTVGRRVKQTNASRLARLTRRGRRALVRVSRLHRVRPGAGGALARSAGVRNERSAISDGFVPHPLASERQRATRARERSLSSL